MIHLDDVRQIPIIGELDEQDLLLVRPHLKANDYESGTTILKQNQESAHFHIILTGILQVYIEQDTLVQVAQLERGQFFGEMSCLTGAPVSATVESVTPVRTLSMPRDGLLLLMEKSTAFRRHMIESMVQRIAKSNDRVLEENARSAALLRHWTEERKARYGTLIGDSPFMLKLTRIIDERAHSNDSLCIIGEHGVGRTHVAWEIYARSPRADYPVFIMDGDSISLEEWETNARAAKGGTIILRKADLLPPSLLHRFVQSLDDTRLLITAKQRIDIASNVIELVPLRERREDIPALVYSFLADAGVSNPALVVSQEAMSMISNFPFLGGNIQELEQVVRNAFIRSNGDIIRTSHLRFGSVREPGTRPKIALALGSGSARGAAHVGVIKVLEQAGIPIDMIAGTSVGAFIGALYAGGQPVSAFERVLPTVRWRQLVRPNFTRSGLVNNHPMIRFVERYIGPVDFKDLRIPFAAVASNAVNGEAYILNTGKVSHAIRASTAIPGVIEPVQHGNHLLQDGAVSHPVPVALARSMGADIVIAVDLSIPDSAKRVPPTFIASILNTIDIMSKRMIQDELQLADIVLNPWIDIGSISFKDSASMIQAGEIAARESLKELLRIIDNA